ncbi:MAG: Hsp20/alpha crystallin family protein [Calditrichaceae bacterium]|jgi:HSP20 family protein
MALVKWSPRRVGNLWNTDVDRWFDDLFNSDMRLSDNISSVYPMVNVEETENEYLISAELPGMEKKDINISLDNNVLSISGEKKQEEKSEGKNYHRVERSYGKFYRSFELPNTVDREKIDANYKNGVLNVSLPKAEEAKPKQIEVKIK